MALFMLLEQMDEGFEMFYVRQGVDKIRARWRTMIRLAREGPTTDSRRARSLQSTLSHEPDRLDHEELGSVSSATGADGRTEVLSLTAVDGSSFLCSRRSGDRPTQWSQLDEERGRAVTALFSLRSPC
jgi:hypothetical protein